MNVYQIIRSRVEKDPLRYRSLSADLVSARLPFTIERYLWRGTVVSLLSGLFFALFGFWAAGVLLSGRFSGLPFPVTVTIADPLVLVLIRLAGTALSFAIGALVVYLLVLRYPGIIRNTRATKINLTLHNAVAYLYAMRKGGAELMVIFRSISDNAPIYGEVALEFRQIVRDADFFGYDVVSAIRHLMETTPSEKLSEFLEDLVSIIESGGNLSAFLQGRIRMYQEEARFEQKQFLNFLALIAESYVTLFVAGPLFLIIIMVVMGLLGGAAVFQMSVATYALIPIGSLVFIVLIDMVSIKSEGIERYLRASYLNEYGDVPIRQVGGEEGLFERLSRYDRVRNLREFLRNPINAFINDYHLTLVFAVPAALVYIVWAFILMPQGLGFEDIIDFIDDQVVIAGLIILIPYGIFYELWSRRVHGVESLIPDFLERMAGINRVGLTIAQAIAIMVNTNLGLLSYEIKRIKRDIDWGANFMDALVRFEKRLSTPMIARTVTLITKASEMSGSIGEVLSIAASDAKMSDTLRRDRLSEMFIYTAIVYLAFFVFLFVVVVIGTQFLPVLATINTQGLPVTGVLAGINTVSLQTFGRLMYHTCLVQALFSGLIAGQMGESSLGAGLKHAAIMLAVSIVVFNVFI
jgi:flagellar protein FlaJ